MYMNVQQHHKESGSQVRLVGKMMHSGLETVNFTGTCELHEARKPTGLPIYAARVQETGVGHSIYDI